MNRPPPAPQDFFRGATASDIDPLTPEAKRAWIEAHGAYDPVKSDLGTLMPALREAHGATTFFWIGFCWGGGVALRLAAEPDAMGFAAAGGVHAALKDDALALAARAAVPLLFLQARNDPDLRPLQDVLDRNEALADRHCLRTLHDMLHGYCSARGDRGNPRVASAVGTTLVTVVDFFQEVARFGEPRTQRPPLPAPPPALAVT